jgi:hypothetical protein
MESDSKHTGSADTGTDVELRNILTSTQLSEEIENLVEDLDIPYMDALLLFAERRDIEVETIATLVKQSSNLESKLRDEAEALNLVEKTARLTWED